MPRYHIHFKAGEPNATPSDHTRCVDTVFPIEYDSDIQAIQEWAAREVGAKSAMLISWTPLKGESRPNPSV